MYHLETFLSSTDKGQPLNKGQNAQITVGPKRVCYSEVPLYLHLMVPIIYNITCPEYEYCMAMHVRTTTFQRVLIFALS